MVRLEGNRNVSRTVLTYNLDAILSVGYRISSRRATQFRQWASRVLKQYMLKGYAINHSVVATQKYEDLKKAVWYINDRIKELETALEECNDEFLMGQFSGSSHASIKGEFYDSAGNCLVVDIY